jgi:hypothetical protein
MGARVAPSAHADGMLKGSWMLSSASGQDFIIPLKNGQAILEINFGF